MGDDTDKWKRVVEDILTLDLSDFSVEFDNLMRTDGISSDILDTCNKLRSPSIEETL